MLKFRQLYRVIISYHRVIISYHIRNKNQGDATIRFLFGFIVPFLVPFLTQPLIVII